MALVTIRRCDRCNREMRDQDSYTTIEHRSQKKELCDICMGKFDKFMNGTDPLDPDYDLARPGVLRGAWLLSLKICLTGHQRVATLTPMKFSEPTLISLRRASLVIPEDTMNFYPNHLTDSKQWGICPAS